MELAENEQLRPVLDVLPGPAYLVGGAVRDLLLRRPGFDVDLAVVGDAEVYAHALGERLSGRVVAHGAFGTAVVHYGDGEHLDVATARTETYRGPGALPEVRAAASIEADLGRRDFTINAMAVPLPSGELIDPHNGREHLADRLVRVLHERSFEDDPTRIFRAVRYETRLGFRMDPKTETLALLALSGLPQLSGARIREELIAVLTEDRADQALARLHQLGVDAALAPEIVFPHRGAPVARLRALNEEFGLGLPRWHLGLLALRAPEGWLAELKVLRRVVESVESAWQEVPHLRVRVVGKELSPAQVVEEVERTGPDTPLLTLAGDEVPALGDYFRRLRGVHTELNGGDLAALGLGESPRVGEVLAELRRRKLNGGVETRADEIAVARELIAEQ